MVRIVLSCVGALLTFAAVKSHAQPIQITPGDCHSGIHLVARDAPLIDVLKELARTIGFELRYEGDQARIINVSATRPPVELISSLSPRDSIIVTQAKDPKCPGRNRVVKVWVLPGAQASSSPASASPRPGSAAPAPTRTFVKEKVMRGAEIDEQSRRAKAAYDEYVRVHGVPPPGVEEEAAKR